MLLLMTFDIDLNIRPPISSSYLGRFLLPYLQPAGGPFVLMLIVLPVNPGRGVNCARKKKPCLHLQ